MEGNDDLSSIYNSFKRLEESKTSF